MHRGQALQVLSLNQGASEDDIKKQYKKLAMKYHPDKNQDEGSEQKFKEISEAYQVLTKPQNQPMGAMNHMDLFQQMFQMHPMHPMGMGGGQRIHINLGGGNMARQGTSRQVNVSFQNGKKITKITESCNGFTKTQIIEENA